MDDLKKFYKIAIILILYLSIAYLQQLWPFNDDYKIAYSSQISGDTSAPVQDSKSAIDIRHKYSFVKLNDDGSKVAGLLELYGTNDFTQAVTINGSTQSGRGTFYIDGDRVMLSRTSGIAIDDELIISKGTDNKLWLTLNNGITYVEDDNSSFLKSMTLTPSRTNNKSIESSGIAPAQNSQPTDFIYEGSATDNQNGITQNYILYVKSDFSAASIGGGPYTQIEDQGNGSYMWLGGTIIGMSFKPLKDRCIIYASDGGYFCTLYRK